MCNVTFTESMCKHKPNHYSDVIISAIAFQISGVSTVYSIFCPGADKKYQTSASLAFVSGIYRWPVNSPHKGSVTPKMFPFDDVIMYMYYEGAYLLLTFPELEIEFGQVYLTSCSRPNKRKHFSIKIKFCTRTVKQLFNGRVYVITM